MPPENRKTTLPTGFGNSYDFTEEPLSLDQLVMQTPSATYFMRVTGDNQGARLEDGDIIVIDRSLSPKTDDIVVAILDSEFAIRRFIINKDNIELYRDDEAPAEIIPKDEFELWGVITYSLTSHRDSNP